MKKSHDRLDSSFRSNLSQLNFVIHLILANADGRTDRGVDESQERTLYPSHRCVQIQLACLGEVLAYRLDLLEFPSVQPDALTPPTHVNPNQGLGIAEVK